MHLECVHSTEVNHQPVISIIQPALISYQIKENVSN